MSNRINVLITGVSGFLGGALLRHLRNSHSFSVRGISRSSFPDPDCFSVDLSDKSSLDRWLKQVEIDVVFHFAGRTHANTFDEYFHANVLLAYNLLHCLRARKNARIFLIGTADQYGESDSRPISEDDAAESINKYALTKQMQEILGSYCQSRYSLDVVFLRIFNIYGRGQSDNFVIPKFIAKVHKAAATDGIVRDKGLNHTRDFVHISDFCQICEKLIHRAQPGDILNVGSGHPISTIELLEQICRFSENAIKPVYRKVDSGPNDVRYQVADNSRLLETIGPFQFRGFWSELRELYETRTA